MIDKLGFNRKQIFVCQFGDTFFNIARFTVSRDLKKRVKICWDTENWTPGASDEDLSARLSRFLKRLNYRNNPLIISFPRSYATCRFLKVPSNIPEEIEKIVSLQSSLYLPYPADELITGFQIISAEKDGSSYINQIIARRSTVERYITLLKQVKTTRLKIILNSYGICNLYDCLLPRGNMPAMVIAADMQYVEITVIESKKLIFSRTFKLSKDKPDWQSIFAVEMNKTRDSFVKEVGRKTPDRIVLLGGGTAQYKELFEKHTALPVEILDYEENLGLSKSDIPPAGIIGLGLKDTENTLNLSTKNLKQQFEYFDRAKKRICLAVFIAAAIITAGLGVARDLDNRMAYLSLLKNELHKIGKEAKNLEDLDKRFKSLETRAKKEPAGLLIISEIGQIMPPDVVIVNFVYEENKYAALRGQAENLDAVFNFTSALKQLDALDDFNIKVRYATERRIYAQEIVDFEIECLEKTLPKKARNVQEDIE